MRLFARVRPGGANVVTNVGKAVFQNILAVLYKSFVRNAHIFISLSFVRQKFFKLAERL